jgi:hypothetical protein
VFSACCFRTYGLTSQERGGACKRRCLGADQIRSRADELWGRVRRDTLGSEEETFPDVSAALRRGIVKKESYL